MNKYFLKFLIFYLLLSFLKFFFAEVRIIGEAESGYLVFKPFPTYHNSFGGGEETRYNINRQKGTWYYEGKYIRTGLDYDNPWWISYFFLLILLWVILTPFVILYILFSFFKRFLGSRLNK